MTGRLCFILAAALLLGGRQRLEAQDLAARDRALLSHLIADIDSARSPEPVPWRVDPRPLRRPKYGMISPSPAEPVTPIDSAVLRSRVAVIHAAGADTAGVIPFDQCPGGMAIGFSHAGCPDERMRVAAFESLPGTVTDSGTVLIGVALSWVRPGGQSQELYRYELRWTGTRWLTLARRSIGLAE